MSRRLEFEPTAAVELARRRTQFIPCPVCGSTSKRYLFHRAGARFVRCRACDLVYADPVDTSARGYFDIAALGTHSTRADLRHLAADFDATIRVLAQVFHDRVGRPPRNLLVIGRWHRSFTTTSSDLDVVLAADIADEQSLIRDRLVDSIGTHLDEFDLILFNEFFEAVHDPIRLLDGFSGRLAADALVTVAFSNLDSLPSRILRRRWKSFFDHKIGYYTADNIETLMWRSGFRRVLHKSLFTTYSWSYLASRFQTPDRLRSVLASPLLEDASIRATSGHQMVVFAPGQQERPPERLSIVVPVYNERQYVGEVLRALIDKDLPIEREIVVVESNSDDGSREIVRSFAGEEGVRVIFEDVARGKGHAVRVGLAEATGTIVMIQDADFEYDLDDYESLLEPILQHHASFVLGSRSLGLDDWKVRRYAKSRVKGFLMNAAQVAFAQTFNLLYQQKVSDINTMFKVFRTECIEGCRFRGNGFNFDIELTCKIVRNGFSPHEVPVNYVARSFDEGKKINFLLDAYPSYFQLFRCRFGSV